MFQVTLCHLKAKIQVDISKSDNSNLESKHDVEGHSDTFGDVASNNKLDTEFNYFLSYNTVVII